MITQTVAVALTAAILWTLHVENDKANLRTERQGPGVQLSLLEVPPMPEPHKPEPVKPKPQKSALRPVAQRSLSAPASPDPVGAADDSSAAVVMAAEPPAQPAGGASHASIEAEYAARLRQIVDARTTLPTSAEYRLLKPSGEAQIRFVLDRLGDPSAVAVARTSGSGILDRQALSIVALGSYPPFPEAAFPGEPRHVFIVTIEFRS